MKLFFWDRKAGADLRYLKRSGTGELNEPVAARWDSAWLITTIWVSLMYAVFRVSCFTSDAGFPGLHWDASYYSTVVLNVANKKGWVFDTYAPNLVQFKSLNYTGHGVLDVFLHGVVLKSVEWNVFERQKAIVHTLVFALWSAVFLMGRRMTWRSMCLASSVAWVMSFLAMQLQGRPEALSSLILLPSAAMWVKNRRGWVFHVVWSITSGLLFCTSPLLGILAGMFTLVFLDHGLTNLGWVQKSCALAGSGSLALTLAFGVIEAVHPEGAAAWLLNMISSGKSPLNLMPFLISVGRFSVVGVSVVAPFWNWIGLGTVVLGGWRLLHGRNFLFSGIYVLLGALAGRAAADYSVVAMFPMLLTIAVCHLTSHPVGRVLRFLCIWLLLLYLTSGVVLVHQAWLTETGDAPKVSAVKHVASMSKSGKYGAFNQVFRPSWCEMLPPGPRWVGISPGMQSVPENDSYFQRLAEVTGGEIAWFVYPQSYRGVPPKNIFLGCSEFQLIFSNWTTERYRIFGVPMPSRLPGYRYAVYEKREGGPLE